MNFNRLRLASIATAAALLASPFASAQIAPYSQNFEGLDAMSPSALGDDGWLVGATVFDPTGTTYLYDYFAFPAPNLSGAFSNVAVGEGGPDQGAQQLVVFNDYANTDHNIGNVIDALVFREIILTAADAGVWVFEFDAKKGDLAGASTARAFVKTLDPGAGFATTSLGEIDTTALPGGWQTYSIAVNISASQAGQLLQVGFGSRAANFEPSGVFYDNVSLDNVSAITADVEQDFEALDAMSPSALGDVDWLVGANVFDPTGTTFLYDYFAFPAPNGTGAFSNVAVGEGGPDQGTQQLVVFNDYGNADHNIGNVIDAFVFQERSLTASDAGVWIFEFDAKDGDLAGASTARAFIKTLDPMAGFFTTSLAEIDTTVLPTTWGTFQIAVNIDASQAGQLLQFGFANTAANFEPSGVFYDNVIFGRPGAADSDGDGVGDDVDNCLLVANADQRDTNGDGHGNICDTDLNNDCVSNPLDLGLFKLVFFSNDADADFNGDGVVNPIDLGIFKSRFFQAPGPSAAGDCTP